MAEAFDFVEYPKILSQPDADPEALVSEALGTFLDRNDLKGCKVAIAVPGQAGLVKFIKLPPVEKKRIPDIVKFEAKQQIPFALEEVVWAYQQIGDKDDKSADDEDDFATVEVGLFAMKRDQINRAIAPFRAAGIEIDVVQMGPIALYNYVTFDQLKGSDLKGSIVLLDIGADNTDLIISDGTRIWQRNVPIGGNHFTRALTKELKLTFAKAEHLKRNATKAPDPKAVFTAMRGIFNDFASEVNRSIGFYSSVNRQAKIIKVVGLGNGFKLPGLQKFLQQNLNGLEVEKLEGFNKLANDEVKDAPQFVENLPSFAVSYGLALQGLGRSQLKTNLLPPEVEQVRILRRKKPWALAASALVMLAGSIFYLGDFKAFAKVANPDFKAAVDKATSVSKQGSGYVNAYNTAKGEFETKLKEGKAMIVPDDQRAAWPKFLQLVNDHIPDPAAEYRLNPMNPNDVKVLDKLRVHIDRIKPVYRTDVATSWFNDPTYLTENAKLTPAPARPQDDRGADRRRVDRPARRPPLQPDPEQRRAGLAAGFAPAEGVRPFRLHHPQDPAAIPGGRPPRPGHPPRGPDLVSHRHQVDDRPGGGRPDEAGQPARPRGPRCGHVDHAGDARDARRPSRWRRRPRDGCRARRLRQLLGDDGVQRPDDGPRRRRRRRDGHGRPERQEGARRHLDADRLRDHLPLAAADDGQARQVDRRHPARPSSRPRTTRRTSRRSAPTTPPRSRSNSRRSPKRPRRASSRR